MVIREFDGLPREKQQRIIDAGIGVFSRYSFADGRTDDIVREAGVSKGLLFHYFGDKKNFYLYLLKEAIARLTRNGPTLVDSDDFYEILFASMEAKRRLVVAQPGAMRFLNMVSKEASRQVAEEARAILGRYQAEEKRKPARTISDAVGTLALRDGVDASRLVSALSLYIDAIVGQYLRKYIDAPQELFDNYDEFVSDVNQYLDLMLYGVVENATEHWADGRSCNEIGWCNELRESI